MNAKRMITIVLAVLMLVISFTGLVSADDKADKFAPKNEETISMYKGQQGAAYGSFGRKQSFGALVTVPEGKRMTQIHFHALAMYNNNTNHIVFHAYRWNTDYETTVKGEVLAQATVINHVDNAPLDVAFPTNRNLTGQILWTATYVDGGAMMTPWCDTEGGVEDVIYFNKNKPDGAFCFDATFADALTVTPASYTATFKADGIEVAKVTFLEGDTELMAVPEIPTKEGFWADWEEYTLNNADITINAVYTDASGAIKPEIEDPAYMNAFSEDHASYLRGNGCTSRVNRDGSVSFIGNWALDCDVDAYATINYLQMMKKYYVNYEGSSTLPNRSHNYKVIAVKVVAPPVALESSPNMTVIIGRNIEIYGVEVINEIKCDSTEEYWIFDFTYETDFSSDFINTITINWAYAYGEESNLGAEFKILGFQLFDTLDEAMELVDNQETEETTEEMTTDHLEETTASLPPEETTEEPTEETTERTEVTTAPENDVETNVFGETVAPEDSVETNVFGETKAPEKNEDTEDTKASEKDETDEPYELEFNCGAVVNVGTVVVLAAAAAAVALKKKD